MSGWSSKFFGLLFHQHRGDRAVGSGGLLSYSCYCLSLLRGWCVVYVGDESRLFDDAFRCQDYVPPEGMMIVE
jgi:hypothetical protein